MNHLDNEHPDHYYTKVVMENQRGEILLLDHSHIHRKGLMPPGGACKVGETPIDCLKRELGEELVGEFDFSTLRFAVHQILSMKEETFFRYGSLYHMFHDGEVSIRKREKKKLGKVPIWQSKESLKDPVAGLYEDNRLMILQILRVQAGESTERINIMRIP